MSFPYDEDQVLDALRRANGIVSGALTLLIDEYRRYITRSALDRFIRSSEVLMLYMYDTRQTVIDTAEDNLFRAVQSGDMKATFFALRTLGRDRGYVQKEEVDATIDGRTLVDAIQRGRARAAAAPAEAPAQEPVVEGDAQ